MRHGFNCMEQMAKIQNSSYELLKMELSNDTFSLIKKYKKYKNSKPLILMGYYQLIYNYGEKKFIKNVKIWVSGFDRSRFAMA